MTTNAHKQNHSVPTAIGTIRQQAPLNRGIFALLSILAAILIFGFVAAQATPAQGFGHGFRARATLTPSSVSFGNVATGGSSTKTITVQNTGSVSLRLSSLTATGKGFSVSGLSTPATIEAGASATFSAVFAPIAAGAASGTISISTNALNSHMALTMTGTATTSTPAPTPTQLLAPSPASLSFGSVNVSASNSLGVTLTNSGNSSVTISGVTTKGTGFTASAMGAVTVAPNETATLTVMFNPTTAGAVSGTVSVASNATNSPASISVSGTGVAAATTAITVSPASLNFGDQNENTTSGSDTVTVTNSGTASVTISEAQAGGPFAVSGFSGSTTLSANQSLTLGVTFDPTAGSSYSDSLTITSTAPSSPNTVALSGTGVAPSGGGSGSGSGAGATTPPMCGIVSNITDIVPSTTWASFVPPAVGGTYTDGGGYCPVTRVTNFVGNSASAGCHYYATESPLDISDAYLMLYDCNSGGWFVDAGPTNSAYSIGTTILSESALSGKWSHDSEPTWDRTTPGMFWVTINNSIESCTVNNSAKSVSCSINHTFSEYAGYRISFMDETDMTPDGWLVTVGQNTQGGHIDVFLFNPATQTKSPVYTTQCSADVNSANNGCIHKLIATPNNGVVIQFESSTNPENGNELWESPWAALSPVELNSGGTGPGGAGGTDHLDTGKDANGIENAVYEDYQNNPGPWGACPDGWRPTSTTLPVAGDPACLFDNRPNNPGWHVSWRGYPNTQFVVYSAQANESAAEAFNNGSGYAAPSSSNWNVYTNEIVMILFGANNDAANIYRLALSHTRGNPGYFWSDPRAAEGYSGNYVVFDSNSAWGATGCGSDGGGDCSDVYIIKVH